MKAMISQPMNGLTDAEIATTKARITKILEAQGYDVVNTFFEGYNKIDTSECINPPVKYLAKSIEAMANIDAIYFANGWSSARGCNIEHMVAKKYGIKILHQ